MKATELCSNQEHEALQRKVFNDVSHDFKTPLACIIGSLEIIEHVNEKLSAEHKAALVHTALMEAHKLDDLITSILSSARPK